jgi:hypothetical protein
MKEQILKIAKDLEQSAITEIEAQNRLLGLFGISSFLFTVGDILTDGVYEAKLESTPTINADFVWLHNDAIEYNKDISGFVLK